MKERVRMGIISFTWPSVLVSVLALMFNPYNKVMAAWGLINLVMLIYALRKKGKTNE
jgi:hypothetical protein